MNVPKDKTNSAPVLRSSGSSNWQSYFGNLARSQFATLSAGTGEARVISFRDTGECLQLREMNVATKIQVRDSAQICIVCRREILDSQWFCRLPQDRVAVSNGEIRAHLICTPRCVLRHFEALRPEPNGYEEDSIRAERSLHMLIDGEKPTWL